MEEERFLVFYADGNESSSREISTAAIRDRIHDKYIHGEISRFYLFSLPLPNEGLDSHQLL